MAQNKIDEFLTDMAGRYQPGRRKGDDILELYTSDDGRTYRVHISENKCILNAPADREASARIETTSDAFIDMMEGRLNVISALMRGKVRVKGSVAMIKDLPRYFDLKGWQGNG